MKIILVSVGTRGDMEPFLGIALLLKERGEDVVCAFPGQFRKLAEDAGIRFASLGVKYIELLDSKAGKDAMGGASGIRKFLGTIRLAFSQGEANKELLFRQKEIIENEQPKRIIYNGKAVYPILWGLNKPGKTVFVSPVPYMHYVKGHTHVAFNNNFGGFFNKLSFSLAYSGMLMTLKISRKWLKEKENYKRKDILKTLKNNKTIYTISPSLFPRPEYWDENLKVLGFCSGSKSDEWKPGPELEHFISVNKKILFISFGSMINPEPEKITSIILKVLEKNKIPAILNIAGGGLTKPVHFNSSLFHFVKQIPYEWIFSRVYAVMHHGGSGTTHLALNHGCSSLIIPHIIDQHVWNTIIYEKKLGPKGIKIAKLNTKNLESKVLELWNNADYKINAKNIAARMAEEDFREEIYQFIIE